MSDVGLHWPRRDDDASPGEVVKMAKQEIRQRARRAVREASATRRTDEIARERCLAELASRILTAAEERDASVKTFEDRAGAALVAMTHGEGLSLKDAVAWLGDDAVTLVEAARLRRLALSDPTTGADRITSISRNRT